MAITTREGLKDYCLPNKYTEWYINIIDRAKIRNLSKKSDIYVESHHIIPRSVSGDSRNTGDRVNLTAREHFVCHLLLTRMFTGVNRRKMCIAVHRLIHGNGTSRNYCKSSKIYEQVKKMHSKAASDRSLEYWSNISKEDRSSMRSGPNNGRYGKPVSAETREKISKANKGKLSKENHPLWGKGHSTETKRIMSENAKRNNKSVGSNNPNYGKVGHAAGKKWYYNPITGQAKLFIPGTQSEGFNLGRK